MKASTLHVDFDNVYIELKKKDERQAEYFATAPSVWLKKLMGNDRKLLVRRCYLNPATFGHYRQGFVMAGFDVVDCPSVTAQGKNSTDMNMAVDILRKLHKHPTHFDEFVLFSADSDFTSVLRELREHNRETFVVHSGLISQAYHASADCVLDFQSLVGAMPALSQELKHEIANFLVSTLKASPSPISAAKLITLLIGKFGEIASAWFGRGKFGALFDELGMDKKGVCFDPTPPGQVYLPELHSLELACTLHDLVANPCLEEHVHEPLVKSQDDQGMKTGTIVMVNPYEHFGFIQPEGGKAREDNYHFRFSNITDVAPTDLKKGSRVSFYPGKNSDGLEALGVCLC